MTASEREGPYHENDFSHDNECYHCVPPGEDCAFWTKKLNEAFSEGMSSRAPSPQEERLRVTLLREALDGLRWCSGSADFNPGGIARVGWEKEIIPLMTKLEEALREGQVPERNLTPEVTVKAPLKCHTCGHEDGFHWSGVAECHYCELLKPRCKCKKFLAAADQEQKGKV